MPLRPLAEYQPSPYRPRRVVILALVLAALAYAASTPLKWVGVVTDSGTYVTVNGLERANWMLGIAVILLAIAVRLSLAPPSSFLRFLFVALDIGVSLGLYIEYIDNLGRAESLTIAPYLGPGFFLALATTGVLIASTVFAWRERDDWRASPAIEYPRE